MKITTIITSFTMTVTLITMFLCNIFSFFNKETNVTFDHLYESLPIESLHQQPYENWNQQNLLFGQYSYYKTPWRSYMDTWDASQYLNVQGINFNVNEKEAAGTAKVLADAGIKSARIEVPWSNMSYEDPTKMTDQNQQKLIKILQALQTNGIRPLILLNANSGAPVPLIHQDVELLTSAKKGDSTIHINNPTIISPNYTGLRNDGKYQTAYPFITGCDEITGICDLSAPLNTDHEAGKLSLTTLKFQPIGAPNTQETVQGWIDYVTAISSIAQSTLGGNGFDLEVWNELSFGSQFLNVDNYYLPKIEQSPVIYKGVDYGTNSYQALLPITVDVIGGNPKYDGVNIINGFSNQRPWENGEGLLDNQAGFSRHYYTGFESLSEVSPTNIRYPNNAPVNALGLMDGDRDPRDWHTAFPGTFFVPTVTTDSPEKWFSGNIIENIVRDIQPAPSQWDGHFRYSHNGNGKEAQVWMTETNWYRQNFLNEIASELGVPFTDPTLDELEQTIATKALLRIYSFYSNKGIHTVQVYAAKANDHQFGVIPEAFFKALNANNGILTPEIERLAGTQLESVKNVTNLMKQGENLESPRHLQVANINVPNPVLQFKGDDTLANPDVFNIDDLAILPTQLTNNSFAIGYYVATQHFTKSYQEEYPINDPRRYQMPNQEFEVTLKNIKGKGSSVSVYDPITDKNIPATVTGRTSNTITVKLSTVDYPRYLLIEEDKVGAEIVNPTLSESTLSFTSKSSGKAKVTWGPYPSRTTGVWDVKYYNQNNNLSLNDTSKWEGLVEETTDETIDYDGDWNPTGTENFSVVWSGQIVPKYSETYYFNGPQYKMDMRVYINNELVYNSRGSGNGFDAPLNQGSIELEAGKPYNIEVHFTTNNRADHPAKLYWWSASQPKEIVSPIPDGTAEKIINVKANQRVEVTIPGGLKYKEGYKITIIDTNGNVNAYPYWNYDTKGVNWDN